MSLPENIESQLVEFDSRLVNVSLLGKAAGSNLFARGLVCEARWITDAVCLRRALRRRRLHVLQPLGLPCIQRRHCEDGGMELRSIVSLPWEE